MGATFTPKEIAVIANAAKAERGDAPHTMLTDKNVRSFMRSSQGGGYSANGGSYALSGAEVSAIVSGLLNPRSVRSHAPRSLDSLLAALNAETAAEADENGEASA